LYHNVPKHKKCQCMQGFTLVFTQKSRGVCPGVTLFLLYEV